MGMMPHLQAERLRPNRGSSARSSERRPVALAKIAISSLFGVESVRRIRRVICV
jgi:hypothetical protein